MLAFKWLLPIEKNRKLLNAKITTFELSKSPIKKERNRSVDWRISLTSSRFAEREGFEPSVGFHRSSFIYKIKANNGGETEIRTLGELPHDSFQDCSIQPLWHLSLFIYTLSQGSLIINPESHKIGYKKQAIAALFENNNNNLDFKL